MSFSQEELDNYCLGFENIKSLIEDKKALCPSGWLVVIISDIDNPLLLKYLSKNNFKKEVLFNKTNPRWRYFTIDEDKTITQLSPEDYIELQEHITLNDDNLVFASKLLQLESKLTPQEQSTLISVLPNQNLSTILKKLK